MDRVEIEAMRAHLAACYPTTEINQRPKRRIAFAAFLRGRSDRPFEPVAKVQAPLDLTVIAPAPLLDLSIPDEPLTPASLVRPPRDGFGRRRDSILSLFDLWEPQPTVLDAARHPRRNPKPDPCSLQPQTPYFPGDLDDHPPTPAPLEALPSTPPPRVTLPVTQPARPAPNEATTLLAGLTAKLTLEQRRLARRLAAIPRVANDRRPPMAFRAAIR